MSKTGKKTKNEALIQIVTRITPIIIRTYFSTLKIRWLCPKPDKPADNYIYTFWHQRQLFFVYTHQNQGVTALISQHRDGDLIAKTIERLGFSTIRGSSTRGGTEALLQMSRTKGCDLAFTPDGPKGPLHKFKSGAIYAAAKTGYPIIPGTCSFKSFWQFRSWDRFMVPKPFTRAVAYCAKPFHVSPEALDNIKVTRSRLEKILQNITNEADQNFEDLWLKATPVKPYFFAIKTKPST